MRRAQQRGPRRSLFKGDGPSDPHLPQPARTGVGGVLLKSSFGGVSLKGVPGADEPHHPPASDFHGFAQQTPQGAQHGAPSPVGTGPTSPLSQTRPAGLKQASPMSQTPPGKRAVPSGQHGAAALPRDKRDSLRSHGTDPDPDPAFEERAQLHAESEAEAQRLRDALGTALRRAGDAESERDELMKAAEYTAVRCASLKDELQDLRAAVAEERAQLAGKAAKLADQALRHSTLEQAVRATAVEALNTLASTDSSGCDAQTRKRIDKMGKEAPTSLLDYLRLKLRLHLMQQAEAQADLADRADRTAARCERLERELGEAQEQAARTASSKDVAAETISAAQAQLRREMEAQQAEAEGREEGLMLRLSDLDMQRREAERACSALEGAARERDAALTQVEELQTRLQAAQAATAALKEEKEKVVKDRSARIEHKLQQQQEKLCHSTVLLTKNDEQLSSLNSKLKQARASSVLHEVKSLRKEKSRLEQQLQSQRKQNAALKQETSASKRTAANCKKEMSDMRDEYHVFFAAHLREQEDRKQREERLEKEEWRVKQRHHASEEALEYYKARLHVTQHESNMLSRQFKRCLMTEQRERIVFSRDRKQFSEEAEQLKAAVAVLRGGAAQRGGGAAAPVPAVPSSPPVVAESGVVASPMQTAPPDIPSDDDGGVGPDCDSDADTHSTEAQRVVDPVLQTAELCPMEAVAALEDIPHTTKAWFAGKACPDNPGTGSLRPQSAPPVRG